MRVWRLAWLRSMDRPLLAVMPRLDRGIHGAALPTSAVLAFHGLDRPVEPGDDGTDWMAPLRAPTSREVRRARYVMCSKQENPA